MYSPIEQGFFAVLAVWNRVWLLRELRECMNVLLVFSVTPFKIDQNKNQNHSTDKVQNLGNERR